MEQDGDHKLFWSLRNKGMTFMEILIVVSLISLISLALYQAFSNGIRIWEKSHELVIEEDVAIFFDKFSKDLNNAFFFSSIPFEGDNSTCSFPSLIWYSSTVGHPDDHEYFRQLGKVEYYYDSSEDALIRRTANYGKALRSLFDRPRTLVRGLKRITFRYYYLTDEGEILSDRVLEVFPSGVEVEVTVADDKGTRILRRYFDVPIGI